MKIEPRILARHLEAAATEQLASELQSEGYAVERGAAVPANGGEARLDLVARRDGEAAFHEVRVVGQPRDPGAPRLGALAEAAKRNGARFRLILVRPERGTDVSVAGLEEALRQALSGDPTGEFGLLGGVSVERVDGVEIERIAVRQGGEIDVAGTAVASVSWMAGPPGADPAGDQIPFGFRAAVGPGGSVLDDPPPEFKLDLSEWRAADGGEQSA